MMFLRSAVMIVEFREISERYIVEKIQLNSPPMARVKISTATRISIKLTPAFARMFMAYLLIVKV
jgi:hypothetical protein